MISFLLRIMPVADGALNVSGAKNDAIEALTALGYSVKEAKSAVMKVEDDENYAVEDYLKMALKYMG